MTRQNKKNGRWVVGSVGAFAVFSVLALTVSPAAYGDAAQPWEAPTSAKNPKNPVSSAPESIAAGKMLYEDDRLFCRDDRGAGDGIAAKTRCTRPANFTDADLMKSETDGSLLWKRSTGRGPMPDWKETLSDTRRRQLVNYIPAFEKAAPGENNSSGNRQEH